VQNIFMWTAKDPAKWQSREVADDPRRKFHVYYIGPYTIQTSVNLPLGGTYDTALSVDDWLPVPVGTTTLYVGIPWQGKELTASTDLKVAEATDETLDAALEQAIRRIASGGDNQHDWLYRRALDLMAAQNPAVRPARPRRAEGTDSPRDWVYRGALDLMARQHPAVRSALLRLQKQFPRPEKYPAGLTESEWIENLRDPAATIEYVLRNSRGP
jgi:hypothetical protein